MNAVECFSHIVVFCMDKTGPLTTNSLPVVEFRSVAGDESAFRWEPGAMVRSANARNPTGEAIAATRDGSMISPLDEITSSATRTWSAVAFDGDELRGVVAIGAPELPGSHIASNRVDIPPEWTARGLRVLLMTPSPSHAMLHNGEGVPALPPDLAPRAWLGLHDELRPNSREMPVGFRAASIDLKIISGDHQETVAALARQAGLAGKLGLVSGDELSDLDDKRFGQFAEEGLVFVRITPEQNERLMAALRSHGHYVAMTGDGVNDALRWKMARFGIAMQSGSQVIRVAADLVLLNDSFGALPSAFREGQRRRMGRQGALGLFLTRVFVVRLVIQLVVT